MGRRRRTGRRKRRRRRRPESSGGETTRADGTGTRGGREGVRGGGGRGRWGGSAGGRAPARSERATRGGAGGVACSRGRWSASCGSVMREEEGEELLRQWRCEGVRWCRWGARRDARGWRRRQRRAVWEEAGDGGRVWSVSEGGRRGREGCREGGERSKEGREETGGGREGGERQGGERKRKSQIISICHHSIENASGHLININAYTCVHVHI